MVAPPRFGKPCLFWRLMAQAGVPICQPCGSQPPCPARSLPALGERAKPSAIFPRVLAKFPDLENRPKLPQITMTARTPIRLAHVEREARGITYRNGSGRDGRRTFQG
jgi:hypothetical protein